MVIKTEAAVKKKLEKKTSEWKNIRKKEEEDRTGLSFFFIFYDGNVFTIVKVFGQKFSKTKQGGLGRYHITVISLCQFHIQDFPRPFESIPTELHTIYYVLCCSIVSLWATF